MKHFPPDTDVVLDRVNQLSATRKIPPAPGAGAVRKLSPPAALQTSAAAETAVSASSTAGERIEPGETPDGLADSDWSSIRQAYEAGRHAVRAQENGTLAARNPGQQWLTRFDGRGFTTTPDAGGWTWGLELRSYGLAGAELPIERERATVSSKQGRVHYDWDAALREWFINDERGLEQGWTVRERPAGNASANLVFDLNTRGGLVPRVGADGATVAFTDASGAAVITYGGLLAWDADHRALPVRFESLAGDPSAVRVAVEEKNARYPITVDPTAQQAYLKASNTGPDRFGWSVAISGDTVIVGASDEFSAATGVNGNQTDNTQIFAGAAYVFVRNASTWSQQAYLKASNTGSVDYFGWSVAISGDTIVIGAIGEASAATGVNGNASDNSAAYAGAAYVFVRNGTTWSQQAYLKASNTDASGGTEALNDQFGWSVAVSGDTIVVGANQEDSAATGINGNGANNSLENSGAAYVFRRSGTTWSQQAYLKASNTGRQDQFGYSVAVSDNTIIVGALGENSAATGVNGNQADNSLGGAGAAYVFVFNGAGWSQQAYLKAGNAGLVDNFGSSVAVSGHTAVVGARVEWSAATGVNGNGSDDSFFGAGAAYVFVRDGSTWSQQAYLKASNTNAGDYFGNSVAISGDTIIVGAYVEASAATGVNGNASDNSAYGAGAAYAFVRTGTTWRQHAYLKASNTGTNDRFGCSVAISGDTAVVGAFGEESGATGINGNGADNSISQAGAAYVFTLNQDSDSDGLPDSWETQGGGIDVNGDGTIDLDLYARGARPDHKDLFVEVDSSDLVALPDEVFTRVVDAFAMAPVQNPDLNPGIVLHLEYDATSDAIDQSSPVHSAPDSFPVGFNTDKATFFGTEDERNDANGANILAAKRLAYRYCRMYFRISLDANAQGTYDGIAEIGGNDFVFDAAVYNPSGFRSVEKLSGLLMHELGHTLGLHHGGSDDSVGKPNYPSVMNYQLAAPHMFSRHYWRLDYSREKLPDLDETHLNEAVGIPSNFYRNYWLHYGVGPAGNRSPRYVRLNGSATDFNNSIGINNDVSQDLNFIGSLGPQVAYPGVDQPSLGVPPIMTGHNDWANLQYSVNADDTSLGALSSGCPNAAITSYLDNLPPAPDSYEGWVEVYPALGTQTAFNNDVDGDGIANGLERFLGSDPLATSGGLVVAGDSATNVLLHTRSTAPADTVASYEWSIDLAHWHPSGTTAAGLAVTLVPAVVAGAGSDVETVQVTPVIVGDTRKLFYRLRVDLADP